MRASKSRKKHVANISVTFDTAYDQILEHRDSVWRQILVILF